MSIYVNPASSLGNGNKIITTAGTRVQLSSTPTSIMWVVITAAPANAGNVTVGGPTVVATADAEVGVTLDAGQSVTLPVSDLTAVWLDSTDSGDEVGYLYGAI